MIFLHKPNKLSYLYHQIRQDFRISFSFVVVYAMGDQFNCQVAVGCGYSASLKPRSVRLEGRLLSPLHSLCALFLYWVHISPVQLAWSVAPQPDFEASVVNTMSRESWATGQLLDLHQRRSVSASLSAKLCDCNPLMKSAELVCTISSPHPWHCQCC